MSINVDRFSHFDTQLVLESSVLNANQIKTAS